MAALGPSQVVNVNVGILGHVDSGKTSLAKALSTTFSTASLDKNPQSQQRGITLDLGFSSFSMDAPPNIKEQYPQCSKLQFTLVDCPGHASLIRTVIGGAQIIDMMLLVIDAKKGIQTQTAECLVIAEVLMDNIIIVLNKVDQFPPETRDAQVEKISEKLRQALGKTKFSNPPIIPVAADVGASGVTSEKFENIGIDVLANYLVEHAVVPKRDSSAPFYFAIDHCFPIKGQGTVVTGTVLSGSVSIGQNIEFPEVKVQRKVKTMQMFRKNVNEAQQGDRLAICVTQLDAGLLERGIAAEPGSIPTIPIAVVNVNPVRFFKFSCKSKSKLHITVGHTTVMATVLFFKSKTLGNFDVNDEYKYAEELREDGDESTTTTTAAPAAADTKIPCQMWAILEFEKPVVCPLNSTYIASRLDTDTHSSVCRLAFHGHLQMSFPDKAALQALKIYKTKEKRGRIQRVPDDMTLIVKGMFRKGSDMSRFLGLKLNLSRGDRVGSFECPFGSSGAFKAVFLDGHGLVPKKGGGKKDDDDDVEEVAPTPASTTTSTTAAATAATGPLEVILRFKKYIYSAKTAQGKNSKTALAQ